MIEEEESSDLVDFLKEIVSQDELEGALGGIAKMVIDKGAKSMSKKQSHVINSFVEKYKKQHQCELCGEDNVSALTGYIFIAENRLCPMCEYDRARLMED